MRTLAVTLLLLGALGAPASAGELLVVGPDEVLDGPHDVNARAKRIGVPGTKGRCKVAARTPLAALLDSRLELTVRDYGSCGRRARDSAGLYVRGIGGDVAKKRGRNGWVYKVRNRQPALGAADPAARTRGRVLWFWCRMGRSGCQRTLAVKPADKTVDVGGELDVRVRAYDDNGRAIPARGATVHLASGTTAETGKNGIARVAVGERTGTFSAYATQDGRVRSFSAAVRIR